jgi:hypothetical protein
MGRANVLPTEGRVLQGMGVGEVAARGEEELCVVPVSASGTELSEAMGSIWPTTHKRAKGNGFGGNAGKDIKGVGGDNVREVGNHCNAVPGIGSLVGRGVDGRSGVRKSRGRVRT